MLPARTAPRTTPLQRVLALVTVAHPPPHMPPGSLPCWLLPGGRARDGRRRTRVISWDGKRQRIFAYRLTYTELIAPVPPGLVLDHLCRRPPCVNPWHLMPVTPGVNARRAAAARGVGEDMEPLFAA